MRGRAGWVLLLLLCAGSVANADDWRQFMRDEYRSNASRDRVPVPLTPIWSSKRPPGISETVWRRWQNPCVIDKGRVFHITLERGTPRILAALDARTGEMRWRVPLNRLAGDGNLWGNPASWTAVTQNGMVVAYDFLPPNRIGILRGPQDAPPVRNGSIVGNPTVRSFRADLGLPLDAHALLNDFRVPTSNPVDPVRRIFFHGYSTVLPYLSPAYPDNSGAYWGPELPRETILGPPLVFGDDIAATSSHDCFFRWRPGVGAQYFRLTHVHPINGPLHYKLRPEEVPHNPLDGFPLVKLPVGYLVADMAKYKYLAAFDPDGVDLLWHLDLTSSVGIPSAEGRTVFMGVNGKSADSGIMAVDAGLGAVRWVYPTSIPIAERIREGQRFGNRFLAEEYEPGTPRNISRGNSGGNAQPATPPSVPIPIWYVDSTHPGAHRSNRGLVVANGMVFGMVGGNFVALDQKTGREVWKVPFPAPGGVVSYAGTRSHILVSQRATSLTPTRLSAFRMDDGKLDWEQESTVSGPISIASGLVFLSSEGQVHAMAPAERTFALGIDSASPADYRPLKVHAYKDEAETEEVRARNSLDPTKPIEEEMRETAEQEAARKRALGEASVVRLVWGRPVKEMLDDVRARQRQLPGVPLVISIDWLDSRRNTLLTPSQGKWWTSAEIDAFAQACAQLARLGQPYYIDIAPELNVYLGRYPELAEQAYEFVQRVGEAVKSTNRSTRVVVSFNAELLLDRYGKTDYVPFGVVPRPRPWKLSRLEPILQLVDAIGITLRPQTGFVFPEDVPSSYLFPLREWFGKKPLVVTAIDVKADIDVKKGGVMQRDFLQQMLKACYWMETKVIAIRLYGKGGDETLSLRTLKTERPALDVWRHVNTWRLVNALSSELALGKKEAMPEPESPD